MADGTITFRTESRITGAKRPVRTAVEVDASGGIRSVRLSSADGIPAEDVVWLVKAECIRAVEKAFMHWLPEKSSRGDP